MYITTHSLESYINTGELDFPAFINSESYNSGNLFRSIVSEIERHRVIFDIILDQAGSKSTNQIYDFFMQEELCLRSLLGTEEFEEKKSKILRNAVTYKKLRIFFVDSDDKDSYYFLNVTGHSASNSSSITNDSTYLSIFLLKDFPEDSVGVQYDLITDIIDNMFAIKMTEAGIPIYHDSIYGNVLCFPTDLRMTDVEFITNYYIYHTQALLLFMPYDSIKSRIKDYKGLSIISTEIAIQILDTIANDKPIKSAMVDFALLINYNYYNLILTMSKIMTDDDTLAKLKESIAAENNEEETTME